MGITLYLRPMQEKKQTVETLPDGIEIRRALVKGQEDERARLAQELHDGIAPLLTTLKLKVGAIEMQPADKEELKSMIDETISEIRRISNNLMPSVLRDFGVGEALRNLMLTVQAATPGLSVRYQSDIPRPERIPREIQLALYRIAQEGVNNALKHARATEIRMSVTQFENYVSLFLMDDGAGFDPKQPYSGNGLRNMQVRAEVFRGIFQINSGEEGTAIEIEIPLETAR